MTYEEIATVFDANKPITFYCLASPFDRGGICGYFVRHGIEGQGFAFIAEGISLGNRYSVSISENNEVAITAQY